MTALECSIYHRKFIIFFIAISEIRTEFRKLTILIFVNMAKCFFIVKSAPALGQNMVSVNNWNCFFSGWRRRRQPPELSWLNVVARFPFALTAIEFIVSAINTVGHGFIIISHRGDFCFLIFYKKKPSIFEWMKKRTTQKNSRTEPF